MSSTHCNSQHDTNASVPASCVRYLCLEVIERHRIGVWLVLLEELLQRGALRGMTQSLIDMMQRAWSLRLPRSANSLYA